MQKLLKLDKMAKVDKTAKSTKMAKVTKKAKMAKFNKKTQIVKMAKEGKRRKWPERQIDQNYQNRKDCQKNQHVVNGKNDQLTRKTK